MIFGADPEFFLFTEEGKAVGAFEVFEVRERETWTGSYGGKAFRDGFSVELNGNPNTCRGNLHNNFFATMEHAKNRAKKKGLTLAACDFVTVDLSEAQFWPPDCQEFGCDPAFSAYDGGRVIPIGVDARTHPRRYAGGHFHFSYALGEKREMLSPSRVEGTYPRATFIPAVYKTYPGEFTLAPGTEWIGNKDNHPAAVKLLDLYCGLPAAYMLGSREQYERRKVYGQAGEFRSQKYEAPCKALGIEYRVPGSTVWNTHFLPAFIMGVGRNILYRFETLTRLWDDKLNDDLRQAINEGNDKLQERLLRHIRVEGFYTFDTLKAVREKCHDILNTFSYGYEGAAVGDSHNSWDWLTQKFMISRTPGAFPAVAA